MSGIYDGDLKTGDLDRRVQAALRVRAERVTLGPDGVGVAWEQTVARKRRAAGLAPGGGRPAGKARRWAAPLAAAASVAVIDAGIGVAASLHPGGSATVAVQSDSATTDAQETALT